MTTPAHKLRDGCLSVTIWRNTNEKGTFYTVNPQRSYRVADDLWEKTDSLNADDLLPMSELLSEAYRWIRMQKQADAKGRRDAESTTAR